MKLYFFGYLFVRFNRVLAILVLILGLIFAGSIYFQAVQETRAIEYKGSDLLMLHISRFDQSLTSTKRKVLQFQGISNFPTEKFSDANLEPDFHTEYATVRDFDSLHETLRKSNNCVDKIKCYLTAHLDDLLADIIGKLRVHAKSLTGPDAPDSTSLPRPNQQTRTALTLTQRNEGLYSTVLKRSEVAERFDTLRNR